MALSKAELVCDEIINTLKISKLHFCVQETPFSAYITIRKKFSQKVDLRVEPKILPEQKVDPCETFAHESDVVEALTKQNEVFLKTVENLKSKIERTTVNVLLIFKICKMKTKSC